MKPAYVSANNVEHDRLHALLARLSDEDLARNLPNGLTVANVLVHLAFWDEYTLSCLRQWQDSGFWVSQTNFEALNSAVLVLAAAIPNRTAVDMLRDAADAVDLEAQSVPPELAEIIQSHGKVRSLERAQHRRGHLDQIEGVLSSR
ncbi:MAG: hypothetical protein Q7V53_04965 [Caldisericota bacterium]|nr:hypothetical protein [Caldisericota bacterium]